MKKSLVLIGIIIVAIISMALVFDWGRRGSIISVIDLNVSSTSSMPIVLYNIKDNQTIKSPVKIEGKARGNWFFEASFPVKLVDADGNVITSTTAIAQSDWATTSFVDFIATVEYTKSTSTDRALLILSNDNPSGNPDFNQSIFVPVILK